MRRAGNVYVSPEAVLEWLGFKGGRIRLAQLDMERDMVLFSIVHEDMPEVPEGGFIPDVNPIYEVETAVVKRTRVYPGRTNGVSGVPTVGNG